MLHTSDFADMYKQVPTPLRVMFQVRLLLRPAGCTDELQELHTWRGLSLLAVQVSQHTILSCVHSSDILVIFCVKSAIEIVPFLLITVHPSGLGC